ncbi:RICIN domain-containing protein [Nonomuraea ceibae]|uniref:RICIN domain-containing protein n=1 Tax=Nonomuraea ceibae TaxID=1935170 RepID=UPI001C5E749A|nr:RICIN domain-containing protein [Nonomuraea ceibae]
MFLRTVTITMTVAGTLTLGGAAAQATAPTHYKIVAKHSGKCLDVLGGRTGHGAPTHQWTCLKGVDSQIWEARRFDDGAYVLIAQHSKRCLDVSHAGREDRVPVVQANCRFTDNQRWWIKQNADGTSRLIAKHSGKCLDVAWAEHGNGGRIVQSRCWGGNNQRWQLKNA